MSTNSSIRFFDEQFQRQSAQGQHALNPFEVAALPYVHGSVLDFGCGMGNLSVVAARRGCSVVAMDGSHAAVEQLRNLAKAEVLPIQTMEADLREYEVTEEFDTVLCIGLLMFFDCPAAYQQLSNLQACVRPGGTAVINVLTEGTTYMDMFTPEGHCLFKTDDLLNRFKGWALLHYERHEFEAPGSTKKVFATAIARKPGAAHADA